MAMRNRTSVNDQTIAPVCVPDDAAPEQEPLGVQYVGVPQVAQCSRKLVQLVIGRLASNFSCRKREECLAERQKEDLLVITRFFSTFSQLFPILYYTPLEKHKKISGL